MSQSSSSFGQTTGGSETSVMDQAREKVAEGAEQVHEQAQKLTGQGREKVRDAVRSRTNDFGGQVHQTAMDLRTIAGELRRIDKEQPARLAEQLSDRVDRTAEYLMRSDGSTMMRDVEDFGRRQPWAVLAGAVGIGFLASRFLKATSSQRYHSSSNISTRSRSEIRQSLGHSYGDSGNGGSQSSSGTESGAYGAGGYAGRPTTSQGF